MAAERLLKAILTSGFAAFVLLTAAIAQDASRHSELEGKIDALSKEVEQLSASAEEELAASSSLETIRTRALEVASELQDIATELSPDTESLQQQLSALKPKAPAEGEEASAPKLEESEKARAERENIEEELAKFDGSVKRATAVASRAAQIAEKISTTMEERFARKILALDPSPFSPAFWTEGVSGIPASLAQSVQVFEEGISWFFSKPAPALVLFAVFLSALLTGFFKPVRDRIFKSLSSRNNAKLDTARGKTIAALLLACLTFLVPVFFTEAVIFYAEARAMTTWAMGVFFEKFMIALVVFAGAFTLVSIRYGPHAGERRLSGVDDDIARSAFWLLLAPVFIVCAGFVLEGIELAATWPRETVVFTYALIALVFAGLLLLNLRRFRSLLDRSEELSAELDAVLLGRSLPFLFELAAAAIILLVLIGYSALAWFLCKLIVWVFTVIAGAAFLGRAFNRLFASELDEDSNLAQRVARKSGVDTSHIVLVGILLSGLVWIVLAILALALIAYPLTPSSATVIEHIQAVLTKIQIGALSITGREVILAIAAFLITILFTRLLRRWMANSFLPATQLDSGVKNSILTAIVYLGYTLAVLFALYSLGVDLSNIALLASALSVGIGFGLQSVVSNFVSGLILLVERPIRVGDWIQAGGEEGIVRKINVRATEVQTFSRETVVIPNAELITNVVKNRMLAGTVGRVNIPIGVAYGTDTRKFKQMLLDIASNHEQVLNDPAPSVLFLDFGDSALMFDLRVHVPDINNGASISSDLRFDILEKCEEEGVEIPFPQQDVHIRSNEAANPGAA